MNRPPKADELRKTEAHLYMGKVMASDVPSMVVRLNPITYWMGTNFIEFAGGNSPIITAPSNGAKWVLICLGYNNIQNCTPMIVNGPVAIDNPPLPALGKNQLPLALVYINAGTLAITNNMVYDARPVFMTGSPFMTHNETTGRDQSNCHTIASIVNLQSELDAKMPLSDIQNALDAKADADGTTASEFMLGKGRSGVPTTDSNFVVNRGNLPPVSFGYNEQINSWEFTNDGVNRFPFSDSGFSGLASATNMGVTKLSIAPADANSPIAVGDNDSRLLTSQEKISVLALDSRVGSLETDLPGKALQSDLDTLSGRVGTLETDLPGKASQSSVSTLSGRVDTLETDMTGKASQSDLDTLSGTVAGKADQSVVDGKASQSSVDTLDGRIASAEGQLSNKANSSTVSTLSGRVDTLETDMTGKASQSSVDTLSGTVAGKADSSTVSTLSGRVDTLESDMTGKASQSSVDTLSGTVGGHTTDIGSLQSDKLDKGSLTTSVSFYAADGLGIAANKTHTVTIANGLITAWSVV